MNGLQLKKSLAACLAINTSEENGNLESCGLFVLKVCSMQCSLIPWHQGHSAWTLLLPLSPPNSFTRVYSSPLTMSGWVRWWLSAIQSLPFPFISFCCAVHTSSTFIFDGYMFLCVVLCFFILMYLRVNPL